MFQKYAQNASQTPNNMPDFRPQKQERATFGELMAPNITNGSRMLTSKW